MACDGCGVVACLECDGRLNCNNCDGLFCVECYGRGNPVCRRCVEDTADTSTAQCSVCGIVRKPWEDPNTVRSCDEGCGFYFCEECFKGRKAKVCQCCETCGNCADLSGCWNCGQYRCKKNQGEDCQIYHCRKCNQGTCIDCDIYGDKCDCGEMIVRNW